MDDDPFNVNTDSTPSDNTECNSGPPPPKSELPAEFRMAPALPCPTAAVVNHPSRGVKRKAGKADKKSSGADSDSKQQRNRDCDFPVSRCNGKLRKVYRSKFRACRGTVALQVPDASNRTAPAFACRVSRVCKEVVYFALANVDEGYCMLLEKFLNSPFKQALLMMALDIQVDWCAVPIDLHTVPSGTQNSCRAKRQRKCCSPPTAGPCLGHRLCALVPPVDDSLEARKNSARQLLDLLLTDGVAFHDVTTQPVFNPDLSPLPLNLDAFIFDA